MEHKHEKHFHLINLNRKESKGIFLLIKEAVILSEKSPKFFYEKFQFEIPIG